MKKEIVTLSSGKKVTILRDPLRAPIPIGHLPTDREWSGQPLVSTARVAYDAYGELIRAGAPDTPEVHAARVEILSNCLRGQYRDFADMIDKDPVSVLRRIPRAVRLTWGEMSEPERASLAARFPVATRFPETL